MNLRLTSTVQDPVFTEHVFTVNNPARETGRKKNGKVTKEECIVADRFTSELPAYSNHIISAGHCHASTWASRGAYDASFTTSAFLSSPTCTVSVCDIAGIKGNWPRRKIIALKMGMVQRLVPA